VPERRRPVGGGYDDLDQDPIAGRSRSCLSALWFRQVSRQIGVLHGYYRRQSADSSGRRNSLFLPPLIDGLEQFVQRLGWGFPAKSFAGPGVEGKRDGCQGIGVMHAEVGSLGKVLAQQPVGILVRAALPGAVRIAEVDMDPGVDPQMGVLSHLRALGQRLPQVLGQGGDRARDGVADRFGAMDLVSFAGRQR
jgi:hypothetical protein